MRDNLDDSHSDDFIQACATKVDGWMQDQAVVKAAFDQILENGGPEGLADMVANVIVYGDSGKPPVSAEAFVEWIEVRVLEKLQDLAPVAVCQDSEAAEAARDDGGLGTEDSL